MIKSLPSLRFDIDISKISKESRLQLYQLLYSYEYNKRIGKKCRSCGHIMGKLNDALVKKGYTSNIAIKFCTHHMDTIDRLMKKKGYDRLLLHDLTSFLQIITGGNR